MTREMIVHFEPRGGGDFVEAEVFVGALGALVEGFKSISNALAPVMAQRRAWSRDQVREALVIGFSAVHQGSLDIEVKHGGASGGPHIDHQWISQVGWSATSLAINGAARGEIAIAEVPLVAAQSFVRAARVARDKNVNISLCSRRVHGHKKSNWRVNVDLTGIEPALTKYVERRSVSEMTTTQLVGKLTSLDHDPPGFVLETGRGKIRVGMHAPLRDKAWRLWGHEVVVLAEAKLTADGKVSDPKAIDILSAVTPSSEEDEEGSFGLLEKSFGTDQAREYFETLRGRN